ncbi:hypothetical protein B0T24DRAFT_413494 [Lasiosphaeria ovina]|uniref:TeaA receptor TeaR n=1 Tax=Lasiosphaeria ovina TaxID=92902 RepID=A0AAE0JXC3_9PEZI|nr:hypothetical protein B0T24DRAFT_413494 [Lasiosphaeria ovina]
MAAVSQTATTFTRPTSSHGTGYPWDVPMTGQTEPIQDNKGPANDENSNPSGRPPMTPQNGNSTLYNNSASLEPVSRKHTNGETGSEMKARNFEPSYVSQSHHKDLKPRGAVKDNESPADSLLDLYGAGKGDRPEEARKKGASDLFPGDNNEDNSKWIHRDKLAKIESEELQAAGFFLPKTRERARSKSQNRARRDQSQDKSNGQGRAAGAVDQMTAQSRKNSAAAVEPRTPDVASVPSWDLRLPEEAAEEGYFVSNGVGKGLSRIPVAKASPVPIPSEHLERDTLLVRKRDHSSGEDDGLSLPRTRARSGSTGNPIARATANGSSQATTQPNKRNDASPKKGSAIAAPRKPSAIKPATGPAGRPRTRGGPSKDSTSSGGGTTRPSTRSGERELSLGSSSKQMEGEPPWMVSAYRPDPRLPPDQQLLPTVARRLQQERWEREGKFGSVYDKEFRPLTDEGFLQPPEFEASTEKEADKDDQRYDQNDDQADWPLKTESRSPNMPGRAGSYSTMPKITDLPAMSPLPSPRTPVQQPPPQPTPAIRVPAPPEEPPQKKDGCGCCVVM